MAAGKKGSKAWLTQMPDTSIGMREIIEEQKKTAEIVVPGSLPFWKGFSSYVIPLSATWNSAWSVWLTPAAVKIAAAAKQMTNHLDFNFI